MESKIPLQSHNNIKHISLPNMHAALLIDMHLLAYDIFYVIYLYPYVCMLS